MGAGLLAQVEEFGRGWQFCEEAHGDAAGVPVPLSGTRSTRWAHREHDRGDADGGRSKDEPFQERQALNLMLSVLASVLSFFSVQHKCASYQLVGLHVYRSHRLVDQK